MRIKIFKLDAETTTEINEICCNLHDAILNVNVYDEESLQVALPDSKNINIAVGDKRLIINQAKKLIPIGRQIITVSVPTHVVPDLIITGNRASISLDGGIFGDLHINGVCGKLEIQHSSFASAQVASRQLDINVNETTVKQTAFIRIEKGQLLAENCFASVADCHLKAGNMGLINLSGSNFTFETETGNITLTLTGCEEEYNTLIRVKSGTSNRPSTQNEGAQKSVKAFSESGNVLIDFVGEKMEIYEAAVSDDTPPQDTQDEIDALGAKEKDL